jgi:release factor H-coupled RctB family protein
MHNIINASTPTRVFASPSSWIEGDAVRQLERLADRRGFLRSAGLPDLHPGHKGPVGCALECDGVVHPDIVGTDVGCGMALFVLAGDRRRLRTDKAEAAMRRLAEDFGAEVPSAGPHSPKLGTVGGGNHFVELQHVADVVDEDTARSFGFVRGTLALLVHSGSRSLGPEVFERHFVDETGLDLDGAGSDYLKDHDAALAFAALNRRILAERAMDLLRLDGRLVVDVPHNHVEIRGRTVLHRKGAAPADRGPVPVAGSRGARSWFVLPDPSREEALRSVSHGAGRKKDRRTMLETAKARRDAPARRNPFGNRVVCEDKRLSIEEAPEAYKNVDEVVGDLEAFGLASKIASFEPIVTFKTAGGRRDD